MRVIKILPVIYINLLLFNLSQAQDWEWSLAAKPDIDIEISGISMPADGLTGWAVGNDGNISRIFHTSDSWKTWIEQSNKDILTLKLKDVSFVDELNGWIVGKHGIILHTTDGGKSWGIQGNGVTYNELEKVSAVDENNVFACGYNGTIVYTNDGENWSAIDHIETKNHFYGISMYDATHGIAVGNKETIYYTTEGKHWNPASRPPTIKDKDFNAVCMIDQNIAWLVGDGFSSLPLKSVFAKTIDGGNTWTLWEHAINMMENMWAIDFSGPTTGVAVGSKGCVFITSDGDNWTFLPRQFGNDNKAVAIVADNIWITGSWGTINYSENFGKKWTLLPKVTGNFLYKIAAVNNDRIIAVGYASSILKTEDGGLTWKSGSVIANNDISQQLWGIDFANSDIGWVAGSGGFIAKTIDGGKSWSLQSVNVTNKWLRHIWAYDENIVWIVGDNGVILKSKDGGDKWDFQGYGLTTNNLNGIDGLDQNRLAIVGNKNTLLYTNDGGQTWQKSSHDLSGQQKINALDIIDETHAWAVGESGIILSSSDAGINWSSQNLTLTFDLDGVCFKNDSTGWIVGNNGTILETTDSGNNWTQIGIGITDKYLKSVDITKDGKVFVCGYGGIIVRYGLPIPPDVIKVKESDYIPSDFHLSQNFPNPFNARTTLNYRLPIISYVTIIVYNVYGQQVTTLVNEIKTAGSYHVIWNAKDITGGIYFVKIITKNFSAVRKVLLVK
jgi:photosystem II stability/assembly factor-like uncharacterized protein